VWVPTIKVEEKGSDVNLAVHLVADGFRGDYEVAVVLSRDSDLCEAVRIVRDELRLAVGIVSPSRRGSVELSKLASFEKRVTRRALELSQLPSLMRDDKGKFHKPQSW
jgi:uncharacterized LabA/DUF88 family protein